MSGFQMLPNCQKTAAAVWSAVRVVLFNAPSSFTSLKSLAYALLVSAFGPFERYRDESSIRNGFSLDTQPSGSKTGADGQPIGRQLPASLPIDGLNAPMNPSSFREASIAAAAASPAATPPCSIGPSGIPASVVV